MVCSWRRRWWKLSQSSVYIPCSVQVCQVRPISPETLSKVHSRDCWITRAVGILISKHGTGAGGLAATSTVEIIAQSALEFGVKDASNNLNTTAKVFLIFINISAIRGVGVIYWTVCHTPLLLIILAAIELSLSSANVITTTTWYGILSLSPLSLS